MQNLPRFRLPFFFSFNDSSSSFTILSKILRFHRVWTIFHCRAYLIRSSDIANLMLMECYRIRLCITSNEQEYALSYAQCVHFLTLSVFIQSTRNSRIAHILCTQPVSKHLKTIKLYQECWARFASQHISMLLLIRDHQLQHQNRFCPFFLFNGEPWFVVYSLRR